MFTGGILNSLMLIQKEFHNVAIWLFFAGFTMTNGVRLILQTRRENPTSIEDTTVIIRPKEYEKSSHASGLSSSSSSLGTFPKLSPPTKHRWNVRRRRDIPCLEAKIKPTTRRMLQDGK